MLRTESDPLGVRFWGLGETRARGGEAGLTRKRGLVAWVGRVSVEARHAGDSLDSGRPVRESNCTKCSFPFAFSRYFLSVPCEYDSRYFFFSGFEYKDFRVVPARLVVHILAPKFKLLYQFTY